jgi:hypothetical protein
VKLADLADNTDPARLAQLPPQVRDRLTAMYDAAYARLGVTAADADRRRRVKGRPRVVGDERIKDLITATLETTPADATHWSTRSMATHLGLSQSMVSRVWRAFGLAPHKQDSWKLSKDPLFVDKVRDVVGLYLDPPERAVVLCVDEKTQIQALNRTAPVFPMLPGTPARASHDYVRSYVLPQK